jgi:hypothetical protein
MAIPTRGRQLIDGVWQNATFDESGGGGLPAGGTTGEVLTKASDADGDADWEASSSLVTEAAYYSGDNVTTAGSAFLPFSILDSGTELFDIGAPTSPASLKAGLFTWCLQIQQFGLPAGVWLNIELTMDYNGDGALADLSFNVGANSSDVFLGGTYVLPVGGVFRVAVSAAGSDSATYLVKNATISRVGPA